jgi:hypothetical protein
VGEIGVSGREVRNIKHVTRSVNSAARHKSCATDNTKHINVSRTVQGFTYILPFVVAPIRALYFYVVLDHVSAAPAVPPCTDTVASAAVGDHIVGVLFSVSGRGLFVCRVRVPQKKTSFCNDLFGST